jgi:hypothetical protein
MTLVFAFTIGFGDGYLPGILCLPAGGVERAAMKSGIVTHD